MIRLWSLAILMAGSPVGLRATVEEPFIYQRLETTYSFKEDGTGEVRRQAKILVNNQAGVQQVGQLYFPYVGGREEISESSVVVLAPDGTPRSTAPAFEQDLPAPVTSMFPLYTDMRFLHIALAALAPGDTIEYDVATAIIQPDAPGNYWVEHSFEQQALTEYEALNIIKPEASAVKVDASTSLDAETKSDKGWTTLSWTRELSARPEDTEHVAVRVTSFGSWREIGEWFSSLRGERAAPTERLRAEAAELVGEVATEEERAAGIYEFVSSRFRYLGILLGVGRYQPHFAEEVLDSGYGDCKDKHTLLAALARSVGIEAAAVLVGASGQEFREETPSPAQFDHLLTALRLEDRWMFVDSTSGVAPFGYLPPAVRGRTALLVPSDGAPELVELPVSSTIGQATQISLKAVIDDEGTLKGRVEALLVGDLEWLLRLTLMQSSSTEWLAIATRSVYHPRSATFEALEVSDLANTTEPLRISYDITIDEWVEVDVEAQELPVLLPPLTTGLPAWEDVANDQGEVPVFAGETRFRLEAELPAEIVIREPVSQDIEHDSGSYYSSSYSVEGSSLRAERTLVFAEALLQPEDRESYSTFREAVLDDQLTSLWRLGSSLELRSLMQFGEELEAAHDARNFKEMIRLSEEMLGIDPTNEYAMGLLPIALFKEGRKTEALESFRNYFEHYEHDPLQRMAYGQALLESGEAEEAFKQLRMVTEVDKPPAQSLPYFAYALLSKDHLEEAEAVLSRCLSTDDRTFCALLLGRLYAGQGKNRAAIENLEIAKEGMDLMFPDNDLLEHLHATTADP